MRVCFEENGKDYIVTLNSRERDGFLEEVIILIFDIIFTKLCIYVKLFLS